MARGRSSSRRAEPADTSSPASRWPTSSGAATPSTRVVFVGTPARPRVAPRARGPATRSSSCPSSPSTAVGPGRTLLGLLALPCGLVRALALVRRLRPAAVLGVGGYAGGPVVLVAALLGVRTVILEPNARPGFTNRVLRPFVDAAACAYEEARAFFGAQGRAHRQPRARRLRRAAGEGPRAPLNDAARLRGQPGLARAERGAWPAPCRTCPGRNGCASSTRRARRSATRWPRPTRGGPARPRSSPSSTTWRHASPRPTSWSRAAGPPPARSCRRRARRRCSSPSPGPPTTTSA